MIALYYEALKSHKNDSTVEQFKAGILPRQDMQNTPYIYSPHYIIIASNIGEAVLSTLRQLKHQVKELRDDIKALKDDNRDFKRQLGNAKPSQLCCRAERLTTILADHSRNNNGNNLRCLPM